LLVGDFSRLGLQEPETEVESRKKKTPNREVLGTKTHPSIRSRVAFISDDRFCVCWWAIFPN
jgi:hypothetical protein